jgi:hypothetical protein
MSAAGTVRVATDDRLLRAVSSGAQLQESIGMTTLFPVATTATPEDELRVSAEALAGSALALLTTTEPVRTSAAERQRLTDAAGRALDILGLFD